MNIFHISEIVDLGIEKEKKRRDFYGMCAKQFGAEQLINLFKQLRDWEETHIKKFTDIRNTLEDSRAQDSYPGELSQYMQSLVDDKLYSVVTPDEFARKVNNPIEAVQFGISFEKDAILFFNELNLYTIEAHKKIVGQLIQEEKQHIVFLAAMRADLIK